MGGAPLPGSRLMRLVYLDEAGISNPAQEPYLVVAGVLVDADRKWKELETYFRNLAVSAFPDGGIDPNRFVFHAMDIWHGNKQFDRKKWPLKDRLRLFGQLAQVPKLFDLPIVACAIDRASVVKEAEARNLRMSPRGILQVTHGQAFLVAVQGVDDWMKKKTIDEVAMLIAEDSPKIRKLVEQFHDGYTYPMEEDDAPEAFRSQYIIDAVHFAKKDKSILLQIADHCAFIIKRRAMGKKDILPFYSAISQNIHKDFVPAKTYVMRFHPDDLEAVTDAA
jgi:hypothetical protein